MWKGQFRDWLESSTRLTRIRHVIAPTKGAFLLVDQNIRQALAGKRFALMGFGADEAALIISTLATVRGLGHVIGDAPNIPGVNSFSPFDACIVNASAVAAADQPTPIELIERSQKPAIIIGALEELVTRFGAISGLHRDFMTRPCEPEQLLLRAYCILKFVESAAAEIRSRNGVRRIVLADDDATTIVMISTILKHFKFECEVAHDGAEALEIALAKKPSLVLLDVSMPKMDGFEAVTALRSNSATRNTPVILVSAHHDEAEVVKGFSLGASDYITKPFNSGELMARIRRVLRLEQE
jgi:PleD family two-component response regulator